MKKGTRFLNTNQFFETKIVYFCENNRNKLFKYCTIFFKKKQNLHIFAEKRNKLLKYKTNIWNQNKKKKNKKPIFLWKNRNKLLKYKTC